MLIFILASFCLLWPNADTAYVDEGRVEMILEGAVHGIKGELKETIHTEIDAIEKTNNDKLDAFETSIEKKFKDLERDDDDCSPNYCLNGGSCTDKVNSFECACAAGYSGSTCATDDNDCSPNYCLNGGSCTDKVNSFECACAAGYSGSTCATDDDDCFSNPCLNGGSCTDKVNLFECACAAGYSGSTCATDSYYVSSQKRTWASAQADCRSRGMYLAVIDNVAEENLIKSKLGAVRTDNHWIGAKCKNTNYYYWAEANGSERQFSSAEISHCGGGCTTGCDTSNDGLRINSGGGWDDVRATTSYYYICEEGL